MVLQVGAGCGLKGLVNPKCGTDVLKEQLEAHGEQRLVNESREKYPKVRMDMGLPEV